MIAGVLKEFRGLFAAATTGLLLALAPIACGQAAHPDNMPPQTVADALHRMSDEAGVIFAGQVTAIREQNDGGSSGFVEVEFRVDQAVRGCTAGAPYILREWAGLWAGGVRRYRVGERLLMFLRAPSASGFSSPINDMDGAVPIHGSSSSLVASGSTAQFPVADLRWIGAQLLRPVSYRVQSPHNDHRHRTPVPFVSDIPMMRARADNSESQDIRIAPMKVDESARSVPAQQASVQTVIGMLRSWQKVSDAER